MKDISASLLLASLFTLIRGEYQGWPEPYIPTPVKVPLDKICKELSEKQLMDYLLLMAFSFSALLSFLCLVKRFYFTNAKDKFMLHWAIEGEDLDCIRSLLDNGADIFEVNSDGETPLHVAVANRYTKIVRLLLTLGADTAQGDYEGNTPLHYAAANQSIKSVKLLLNGGAAINQMNKVGATPLHYAIDFMCPDNALEIIKILLNRGAAINQGDNEGYTPLHGALWQRDIDVIKLLLDRGANITQVNHKGETPLTQVDSKGNTPFHWAVYKKDIVFITSLIRLLLDRAANITQVDSRKVPLHCAAQEVDVEEKMFFLDYVVNIDQENPDESSLAMIGLLLEHSGAINQGDEEGNTLLHYAIRDEAIDVIRFLLDCGADIAQMNHKGETPLTQVDGEGNSPLHWAIEKNDMAMQIFLLNHGVNINQGNHKGNTPLHYAAINQSINNVKLLVTRGAAINPVNNVGATPLHHAIDFIDPDDGLAIIEFLLDRRAAINQGDNEGNTPLHGALALWPGDIDLITFLLDRGADITQVNHRGKTPLTQVDSKGNTPLHWAVKEKNVDLLRFLLDNDANPNQKNHRAQTPFDLIPEERSDIKKLFAERLLRRPWQGSVKENLKHEQPDNKNPLAAYYTDNLNFSPTFYHQWLPREVLEDTLETLPQASKYMASV